MPSDVQDALVTVLSEKSLPVPELTSEVRGRPWLQPDRHRQRSRPWHQRAARARCGGASTPSCSRCPRSADEEIAIVAQRVAELGAALALPPVPASADEIRRVVTVFRELRSRCHRRRRAPASRCRAARCRRRRRSRSSPTVCRWPPTSATARCRADDVAAGVVGAVVRDPGPRRHRLARVPRGRRRRPRRLGRLLRGLPRAGLTWHAHGGPPARDPAPRSGLGAVGAWPPSTSCSPRSCSSSRRPRPPRRWRGSATTGSSRRWRCSAMSSTSRGGRCSRRSPRSAPSGRPSRWANARRRARSRRSTSRWPTCSRAGRRPTGRRRIALDGGAPADPLGALAAAAGEPDAERWWDDVIEHRGEGLAAFEAVAEAMAAVRAGTVPSLGEAAARGAHAAGDPGRGARRPRRDRRRLRGVARAGARRRRHLGDRRRCHVARPAEGQGRGELGAVDQRPARRRHRLRRRRAQPGLVRPRVPPSRARRHRPVLRRRRPRAARRRPAGVTRPPDRGDPRRRRAGR